MMGNLSTPLMGEMVVLIKQTFCVSSPEMKTYETPFNRDTAAQIWNDFQVLKQMRGIVTQDTFVIEHVSDFRIGIRSNGYVVNLSCLIFPSKAYLLQSGFS